MRRFHYIFYAIAASLILFTACREDEEIYIPDKIPVSQPEYTSIDGFYLLNEGNMGDNKSTLDYYDYKTGVYTRNIFGAANPTVPKEIGDVGNDIAIYGSKMYAVINCSNYISVLDKYTAKMINKIDIPNCRYIKFYKGFAYVSSYVGPVVLNGMGSDDDVFQLGAVFKVDTVTMQVVDTCVVGRQPDELDIADGKIYVANSGGYSQGAKEGYENTVSVIDIATFEEIERIPIAMNLMCCRCDERGILWVTSRGDYYGNSSKLFAYNTLKHRMEKTFDIPVGTMCMDGDSLYVISAQWSFMNNDYGERTFKIINTKTLEVVNEMFISDGTETTIEIPYGIAVHPFTKEIYLTDAGDYVHPGFLHCYTPEGVRKWSVRTGDIPAHFVFLGDNINEQ